VQGPLRLLFAKHADKRTAVIILEHGRLEFRNLRPDHLLCELHHLGRELHLRNFREILLRPGYGGNIPKSMEYQLKSSDAVAGLN
jgi:hypothetical protein